MNTKIEQNMEWNGISLFSEFIVDVYLLFLVSISWLVSELWPKDRTLMSEISDFWDVFRPFWSQQTKILNSGSTNSEDHGFEVFAKIWLKSVVHIWRIFAETKWKDKPLQNKTQRHDAGNKK